MVTRSLNLSEIKNLYETLKESLSGDLELIVVVRSDYIANEITLKVQCYNVLREMTYAY